MNRRRWAVLELCFLLAATIVLYSGCSAKLPPRIVYTPNGRPEHRVCVFYDNTSFKQELVYGVAKMLRTKGIEVITDSTRRMDKYSLRDFDLAVVIGTVRGFRPSREVVRFLETRPKQARILYVATSAHGDLTGMEGRKNVEMPDTITAASASDSLTALVRQITKEVVRSLQP